MLIDFLVWALQFTNKIKFYICFANKNMKKHPQLQ